MSDKQIRELTEAAAGFAIIITWCLITAALIKFIFFM